MQTRFTLIYLQGFLTQFWSKNQGKKGFSRSQEKDRFIDTAYPNFLRKK